LTSIDFGSNKFGSQGATAIAQALKINENLCSMGLMMNKLGRQGATDIAEALIANRTLTSIDLRQNQLDETDVDALVEALAQNKVLTKLQSESKVRDRVNPYLQRNRNMKRQGCLTLLALRHNRRGLWAAISKDVLQLIVRQAFPEIVGENQVKYPMNSVSPSGVSFT